MPRPLVNPTTQPVPQDYLVSLIIRDSAGGNISIPANKAKLESSLASYYKDKKNLPSSTTVTAMVSVVLLHHCCEARSHSNEAYHVLTLRCEDRWFK